MPRRSDGGRVRVYFEGDASGLQKGASQAQLAVTKFGTAAGLSATQVQGLSKVAERQQKNFAALSRAATVGAAAVVGGSALIVRDVIKTGMAYEQEMARVQGVTDATAREMEKLNELAIEQGALTKFSAAEAAQAIYELGSAGFEAGDMASALPGTLSLAAASNIELAAAAEISANALKGFGLATSESVHVADVMALTANKTSVEMADLQASMKYIGPVAKNTGQSFELMSAALGVMGDTGIKGQQAGTTLRAALLQLLNPVGQAKKALGEMNLEAEDLQGPNGLKPLPDIIETLNERLDGMSTAQQKATLSMLFGRSAVTGMMAVIDAGPDQLRELSTELENSAGAAKRAAETMNDTVAGAWDEFTGSLETLEIQLYQKFETPLKESLRTAAEIVNREGAILNAEIDRLLADPAFVHGSFGDKMDAILDVATDRWEAWDIADPIRDAIVEGAVSAIPVIAEHAGILGLEFAKGLVEGFANADILGKLFIGGLVIRYMGGIKAIAALGGVAGSAFGTGFSSSAAASMGGAGAAGGMATTGAVIGGGNRRMMQQFGLPNNSMTKKLAAGASIAGRVVLPLAAIAGGASFASGSARNIGDRFQNASSTLTLGLVPSASGRQDKVFENAKGQIDALREAMAGAKSAGDFTSLLDSSVALNDRLNDKDSWGGLLAKDAIADLRDEINDFQKVAGIGEESAQRIADKLNTGIDKLYTGGLSNIDDIERVVAKNEERIGKLLGTGSEEGRKRIADNYRAAASAINRSMNEAGDVTDAGMKRMNELIREADLAEGVNPEKFGKQFAKAFSEAEQVTKAEIRNIVGEMKKLPPEAQQTAYDAMADQLDEYVKGGKLTKDEFRDIKSGVLSRLDDVKREGPKKSKEMTDKVGRNFQDLAQVGALSMDNILKNANGALGEFGAKQINFSVKMPTDPNAMGPPAPGFAAGGRIPGYSPFDDRTIAVRGGERVLTPETHFPIADLAMRATFGVGLDQMLAATGGLMFAKGGRVTGDTDYSPAMGKALNAMSAATNRAIYVQDGGRTLAEQGVLFNAYLAGTGNLAAPPSPTAPHVRGVAADITPGREAFGNVAGRFGLGFTVPSESWHIQLTDAAAAMRSLAATIQRPQLVGPSGALRNIGQGAINRVHKAATGHIRGAAAGGINTSGLRAQITQSQERTEKLRAEIAELSSGFTHGRIRAGGVEYKMTGEAHQRELEAKAAKERMRVERELRDQIKELSKEIREINRTDSLGGRVTEDVIRRALVKGVNGGLATETRLATAGRR